MGIQAVAAERPGPPLVLTQGEQRLVSHPGLQRYALGSAIVRGAKSPNGDPASVLLKAIKPGRTDLVLISKSGQTLRRPVRVEAADAADLPTDLLRALSGLATTEVHILGKAVFLRGEVQTQSEALAIRDVEARFGDVVHDETDWDPALTRDGERKLQALLAHGAASPDRALWKNLRVERAGTRVRLLGTVGTETERREVVRTAKALWPLADVGVRSREAAGSTVTIRVYLLELSHSAFRKLGIGWGTETTPLSALRPWQLDATFNIEQSLQALSGEGMAQILANPELVVRAPGQAKLFAGGELPIRQVSRFQNTVTWRPYGLTLKLILKDFQDDRVRLDVHTEFSHLDVSAGHDDLPGIRLNTMSTQIDARLGQPVLLAGLLQEKIQEDARGLPALRSLPILGALFRSENFLKEKSELVAVLVPNLDSEPHPMSRISRELPRGPLPLPRNWISADDLTALKQSPHYPWNAL